MRNFHVQDVVKLMYSNTREKRCFKDECTYDIYKVCTTADGDNFRE